MPGYLIIYERTSGNRQVIEYHGKEGHRKALQQRLILEAEKRFIDKDVEIVAISSKSLDTVKTTHARYFQGQEIEFLDKSLL
jgi:hypothetical protein